MHVYHINLLHLRRDGKPNDHMYGVVSVDQRVLSQETLDMIILALLEKFADPVTSPNGMVTEFDAKNVMVESFSYLGEDYCDEQRNLVGFE